MCIYIYIYIDIDIDIDIDTDIDIYIYIHTYIYIDKSVCVITYSYIDIDKEIYRDIDTYRRVNISKIHIEAHLVASPPKSRVNMGARADYSFKHIYVYLFGATSFSCIQI